MKLKLPQFAEKEKHIVMLFLLTFLSRLLFIENEFFDTDTIGIAFGTISYSLDQTRPHLPGYFLHVKLISFINFFVQNIHTSMLVINMIYFSLGVIISYLLLIKWFPNKTSFVIVLLVIFNPLVWFYSSTTDTYPFDFFIGALTVLVGINPKYIKLLPSILALSMGVRQTTGLLLLPLNFYLWWKYYKNNKVKLKEVLLSHVAAIIVFIAWFVPMIETSGGLQNYLQLYKTNSPLPETSIMQNIFQFSSYSLYIFLPFTLVLVVVSINQGIKFSRLKEIYSKDSYKIFFLWLTPALLQFIFFVYNKGYYLLIGIPLFGLLGQFIDRNRNKYLTILFVVILQSSFFIFYPVKEQGLESIISPQKRNSTILNVWFDRTFSAYLMTNSKLRERDNSTKKLCELLMNSEILNDKKVVFIDPTISLYARVLQYKFPKSNFIAMDVYNKNGIIEYEGLNISRGYGFREKLPGSILVTRKDFYERYLASAVKNYAQGGGFVLLNVENADHIINLYQKLFSR